MDNKESPSKFNSILKRFTEKNFLLSVVIFVVTAIVGTVIFVILCDKTANWQDLGDASADTDMSVSGSELTKPYGDGYLYDMTEYEKYINPIQSNKDSFIFLVGVKNPLKKSYTPKDITELLHGVTYGKTVMLSEYAAKALEAMFLEMNAQGVQLTDPITKLPLSAEAGYISYDEQKRKFDKEVQKLLAADPSLTTETAEKLAEATVAKPGTDEHQSGLSVDIHNCETASVDFKNSEAYKWLTANCHKFGFVLRYPEDKTDITGVPFRPWQFRYVGRHHATNMFENKLCLEEYIDILDSIE